VADSGCLAMYSVTPVVGDHSGSGVVGPAISLRRWWRIEVDLERFLLPAPAHFLRTSTLTSRGCRLLEQRGPASQKSLHFNSAQPQACSANLHLNFSKLGTQSRAEFSLENSQRRRRPEICRRSTNPQ
jgi:hypothetical protein